MTLIAGTIHKSFPVLMGDILITTENIKESINNIMLPTYFGGDENPSVKSKKRFPVELKQKVYIINSKLCLALAGNVWHLKIFLKDVRDRFKYINVNADNVQQLCNEFDEEFLSQINYIFFGNYLDGNTGSFFYYGSNINKKVNHNYFGICFAAGSGAISFLKEIDNYQKVTHISNHNSSSHEALCTNIYLITKFLLKEKINTASIEEGWGCGFELICYNGETFYKVDDITYIYIKLTIKDGIIDFGKLTPYFIVNFKYYNDLLKITAYDSKNVGTFFATPIDKEIDDIDHSNVEGKFTFGTDNVLLCFFSEIANGHPEIYKLSYFHGMEKNAKKLISINIDYDNKIISATIDPELFQRIFLNK